MKYDTNGPASRLTVLVLSNPERLPGGINTTSIPMHCTEASNKQILVGNKVDMNRTKIGTLYEMYKFRKASIPRNTGKSVSF